MSGPRHSDVAPHFGLRINIIGTTIWWNWRCAFKVRARTIIKKINLIKSFGTFAIDDYSRLKIPKEASLIESRWGLNPGPFDFELPAMPSELLCFGSAKFFIKKILTLELRGDIILHQRHYITTSALW